jgi:putative transposon-encoded protein
MRTIKIENKKMTFRDEIENIIESKVKKIGTGAMVLIPKKYINQEVYVLVKKK